MIDGDIGQGAVMRPLLPDALRGFGEAAGAESLVIDELDDGIMRCIFGEIQEVVLFMG